MRCKDCKLVKPSVKRRPCPYQADVHNKKVIVALCDQCEQARAEEI